jgi:hypothetical protein
MRAQWPGSRQCRAQAERITGNVPRLQSSQSLAGIGRNHDVLRSWAAISVGRARRATRLPRRVGCSSTGTLQSAGAVNHGDFTKKRSTRTEFSGGTGGGSYAMLCESVHSSRLHPTSFARSIPTSSNTPIARPLTRPSCPGSPEHEHNILNSGLDRAGIAEVCCPWTVHGLRACRDDSAKWAKGV